MCVYYVSSQPPVVSSTDVNSAYKISKLFYWDYRNECVYTVCKVCIHQTRLVWYRGTVCDNDNGLWYQHVLDWDCSSGAYWYRPHRKKDLWRICASLLVRAVFNEVYELHLAKLGFKVSHCLPTNILIHQNSILQLYCGLATRRRKYNFFSLWRRIAAFSSLSLYHTGKWQIHYEYDIFITKVQYTI